MKKIYFGLLLLFFCTNFAGAQDGLTIAFNEKPPFFYSEDGKPKGILVERAEIVLKQSGINYNFKILPFQRIMAMLENKEPNFAALGFSKTPEREKFIIFSSPIYQDQKPKILVRIEDKTKFEKFGNLDDMTSQSTLTFGGKAGNSYPIDAFLKKMGDRDKRFEVEAMTLPQLLLMNRFDFTIIFPEEKDIAFKVSQVDSSKISEIDYPDVPLGGLRYFLFSQKTDQTIIEKLDQAISTIFPDIGIGSGK